MGAAGWRLPGRMAGEDRLCVLAAMLAREFRRFDFGTRRMRDHVSIEAVRHDRDEPGVHVVITNDLGEMRRALREDEGSPPGGGGNAPPGACPPGGG